MPAPQWLPRKLAGRSSKKVIKCYHAVTLQIHLDAEHKRYSMRVTFTCSLLLPFRPIMYVSYKHWLQHLTAVCPTYVTCVKDSKGVYTSTETATTPDVAGP